VSAMSLWQRLAPRERRVITIGATLILAGWLALRAAPRVAHEVRSLRERTAVATLALPRARATLALEPIARESLAARARRLVAYAPRLFGGTTPSEAAAELSSFVAGAATTHRVRIVRQDTRPDSSASLFVRLTLRLEADGDVEGLSGWIASLEESPRLLDVQAVGIRAPDPAASPAQPERLHAELVVTGWGAIRHPTGS